MLLRPAHAHSRGGGWLAAPDSDWTGACREVVCGESGVLSRAPSLTGRVRRTYSPGLLTTKAVPYIVFLADLTISLASGMTIKFFPLFWKDDCHMSPAEVLYSGRTH